MLLGGVGCWESMMPVRVLLLGRMGVLPHID
jgi:hypothetical protein